MVLLALVLGLVLWQRPWVDDEPAAPTRSDAPVDAPAALTRQIAALSRADSVEEFAAAAGDEAWAQRTWAGREALDVGDVSWRYVSGADAPPLDDGDRRVTAEVSWAAGSARVDLRLASRGDGFAIVDSSGSGDDRLPVWLAGAIDVEPGDGRTVVRVDGGDSTFDVEAATRVARATVEATIDDLDRSLVVVSTPDTATTAELLGQPVDALRQIAAVSTSFDPRDGSLAGPAVVLNPAVFATMDQRARQVVMSHEATHVLSGSVGTRAETWVVEGFADYVALRQDTAPLDVSAGQILRQVAEQGAPERLPTTQDFDGATDGLGAVYESAWMIFRLLGERYGAPAVVAFYDAVLAGTPVDRALSDTFGITVAQLTDAWRRSLTTAASDL